MATPCQDAASAHLRCASAWAVGDMGCLGVAGCPEGLPCAYSASAVSVACRLALASTMSSRRCGRGRGGGVGWGVRGTVEGGQHCAGCSARAQAGRHCPSRAPPGSARPTQHGCHHARHCHGGERSWHVIKAQALNRPHAQLAPQNGCFRHTHSPPPAVRPGPTACAGFRPFSLCCSAWGWLSAST